LVLDYKEDNTMSNTNTLNVEKVQDEVLTPDDIFRIHKEVFGADPVITGACCFQSEKIIDRVIDAINKGIPYVEPEVPDGADI